MRETISSYDLTLFGRALIPKCPIQIFRSIITLPAHLPSGTEWLFWVPLVRALFCPASNCLGVTCRSVADRGNVEWVGDGVRSPVLTCQEGKGIPDALKLTV